MISVKYLFAIFILVGTCAGQEDFFTNEQIRLGLILPFQVDAVVGEDVFLRLTDTVPNQQKCLFHRNGGADLMAPKDK